MISVADPYGFMNPDADADPTFLIFVNPDGDPDPQIRILPNYISL